MSTITKQPRRRKDEAKNEAILKAATRLFLKKGYSNTSMDAIADAARVTKQTVYAHYKSKDALFTQMLTHLFDRHTPAGNIPKDEAKTVEQLLYEIGSNLLTLITSAEGLAMTRLVISEVTKHPKLANRYYHDGTLRLIAMLSDFLDGQKRLGRLHIADTTSAASHFFAILKGHYHVRMILGIRPVPPAKDKEAHVRETVRIFMHIYGGATPLSTISAF
ncbi:MAG: TetR/AcrR family transcriptional regulator [Rickettsiales bacterium]|nr:TetR/AcrR family transcriptional regulator [Rickettsiales bacterium]